MRDADGERTAGCPLAPSRCSPFFCPNEKKEDRSFHYSIYALSALSTRRAASIVWSMSASVCLSPTNPASNCEGAR